MFREFPHVQWFAVIYQNDHFFTSVNITFIPLGIIVLLKRPLICSAYYHDSNYHTRVKTWDILT